MTNLQNRPIPQQGILFSVNDDLFALDLALIREVVIPEARPAPLPLTPHFIKGLVLCRNEIYPIVHLGTNKNNNSEEQDEARIILVSKGPQILALFADQLHNIYQFPSEFQTDPQRIPFDLREIVDTTFETPIGQAYYLDFQKLYDGLINQANQLDKAEKAQ